MAPATIKLHDILKENVDLLSNNAAKKQIQLLNKIDSSAQAFADVNMVSTVIRNLMSNAIKYTKDKGSITGSYKIDNDKGEISISDTGVGIKPENLDKLFKIDVNYLTKGTANETGTGLGLILCKEFINKNGGEIWVESEFGKGSIFKFTLPLKK
ncbi:Adaptive-response sensory-kinase SasA [subsurface metagenome]